MQKDHENNRRTIKIFGQTNGIQQCVVRTLSAVSVFCNNASYLLVICMYAAALASFSNIGHNTRPWYVDRGVAVRRMTFANDIRIGPTWTNFLTFKRMDS